MEKEKTYTHKVSRGLKRQHFKYSKNTRLIKNPAFSQVSLNRFLRQALIFRRKNQAIVAKSIANGIQLIPHIKSACHNDTAVRVIRHL